MVEVKIRCDCDDGTMPPTSVIYRWGGYFVEAGRICGKSMEVYKDIPMWLAEAKYTNVACSYAKTPVGGSWCQTEEEREIGRWNAVNVMEGMEGFSLAIFTRLLGWDPIEVQALLGLVRTEIQEQKVHAYFRT